jgi:hypothetical protein
MFSLNQGIYIALSLLAVLTLALVLPLLRKRPLNSTYIWTVLSLIFVFGILLAASRSTTVNEYITDRVSRVTQVPLDYQVAWTIATSAISRNITSGLFGLGYDTFSIAYNGYRNLDQTTNILQGTNFTYSSNQVLNILSNMGIMGIVAWILLAYLSVKDLVLTFTKKLFDSYTDLVIIVLNLTILFILASSFFAYFNFLILFATILTLSMKALLKYIYGESTVERFVIKMDMFVEKFSSDKSKGLVNTLTIITVVIIGFVSVWFGRNVYAGYRVIKAERITSEAREKEVNGELSDEERKEVLVESTEDYRTALSMVSNNPLYHRRTALILSEYVTILAEEYNDVEDSVERNNLFQQISTYIDLMKEEAEKATVLAPSVYSNWGTRANVYTDLVGLGLTSFSKSAITSLQQASSLNPLNYDLYYNAAQLYIVQDDVDSALRSLGQVFNINPYHIPSLVLAGELSQSDGDLAQAERYFTRAKDAIERFDTTDSDIYDYVVEKLVSLGAGTDGDVDQSSTDQEVVDGN